MKTKMIKIILCALIIISVSLFGAIAYFNAITMLTKVKMLVIDEIESATHKKVLFQSIRLDIVKGFVVEGPIILYDDTSTIIKAKEVNCNFFVSPLFKKQIAISAIKIESPSVLLERRTDNSFNILELIPTKHPSIKGMTIAINRIIIKNGRINFVDNTLTPPFRKKIEKINVDLRLSLPADATFSLIGEIPSDLPIKIKSSGKYSILQQELDAQIMVNNLSLKEFVNYYDTLGLSFPKGTLDATLALHVKDNVINADIDAEAKNLFICKDKLEAKLNSGIHTLVQYDIKNKQIEYAGKLDIHTMDIVGIDKIGKLEDIKANIEFNDSRLWSDDISIDVFDIPWKVKLNIVNFTNPIFDIYAASKTNLSTLRKILEDNFKIKLPIDIAGNSDIELALQMQPNNPLKLNGYIHMHDAIISLGGGNFPIEHVNGETHFTSNALTWSDLDFTYRGIGYKTSGALTDFASPGVQISVTSKDLSLESAFTVNDKLIDFSQLKGRYMNSQFSVAGEVNFGDPNSIDADLAGTLDLKLEDLKNIIKAPEKIDKMKLGGKAYAEFELSGNIKKIKACNIDARIKSDYASLYGLKLTDMALDYTQEKGVGSIKSMSSSFYGGTMWATGRIDWFSKDLPYSLNLNMKDVKLERFKKDAGFKDKDVAGDIKVYANINGFINDFSKLTGIGKISIANGKLWELDLFRGLGTIIFTSNFNDIIFTEGSCDFRIENRAFVTNDFNLKSNLLNLYGSAKVGFDRSINALLKSELTEEGMYPGIKKNIATAIGKYTSIEVSGTLKEPKCKLTPSISDAVEDMANNFFQQ